MKAYVLHGINDLKYEEVEQPTIKENEVLVEVKAAGICGSDIPRIFSTGAHKHPLIPGHEFSGQVVATGGETNRKWANKRVGIFPLIPCGVCNPCKTKQYEMCKNYSYLGSRTDGGFAEYVAVPENNLIELPEGVSYESAAMLEPMAVAVHAIRKLLYVNGIKDFGIFDKEGSTEDIVYNEIVNKNVCVYGLGTVGLLIVMFLKKMGFNNIMVVGNKEFQKEQAVVLGISEDEYCDSKNDSVVNWVNAKTDGNGADLLFECVGKNETINQVIDAAAPSAGIVFLGNPYSDVEMEKNLYWKILRKQLRITGTWNSAFTRNEDDDWHYVLKCLKNRQVEPGKLISHRLDFDKLFDGLNIMHDKTEDYVKVMVVE